MLLMLTTLFPKRLPGMAALNRKYMAVSVNSGSCLLVRALLFGVCIGAPDVCPHGPCRPPGPRLHGFLGLPAGGVELKRPTVDTS